MDLYGQDEAINQLNSRNANVVEHNQELADYNMNVMNEYRKEKGELGVQEKIGEAKDILDNFSAVGGMKQAWDNRKETLLKQAKAQAKSKVAELSKGSSADYEYTADKTTTPDQRSRFLPDGQELQEDPTRPGVFTPKDTTGIPQGARPVVAYGGDTGAVDLYNTKKTAGIVVNKPAVTPVVTANVKEGENVIQANKTSTAGAPQIQGETAPTGSAPENTLKAGVSDVEEGAHTLTGKAISKATGGLVGEATGDAVGKIGGALVSAGTGAVALTGDIENMVKNHGNPFKKGASWEDDANNVGSVIGGVSDVIGLVPGLEWVAGLGNLISGAGNVIGLFGDHEKNKQKEAQVEKIKTQVKAPVQSTTQEGTISYSAPSTLRGMSAGSGTF